MTSPSSTVNFPTDERWYQTAPDLLVALRVYGTPDTYPLQFPASASVVMGRGKLCELSVQRKHMARQQARLQWVDGYSKLRITNLSDKNDIVLNGELAQPEITLEVGDWFTIGDSRYYVLNEEMRLAQPWLLEYLGSTNYALIDDLMIAASRDGSQHFMLIGEAGCAQKKLASIIHRISRRRANDFESIDQEASLSLATQQTIRTAKGGTIFVDVHKKGRLDPRVAEYLTRENAKVRLIVSAPSPGKFAGSFPELVHNVKQLDLPSLRKRKADIPDLIDRWASQESSPLRFVRLRLPLRKALCKYDWPENYDELFAFGAALRLLATVQKEHTPRQVERDSTVLRSTRDSWEKRLGLKLEIPLMLNGEGATPLSNEDES